MNNNNNEINKLLIRDFYQVILEMADKGIVMETHVISDKIEKGTLVDFLINNHKEYFKDSLLLLRGEQTIRNLNIILSERENISYRDQIRYDLINSHIKNNGIFLILSLIFDIQSLILYKP